VFFFIFVFFFQIWVLAQLKKILVYDDCWQIMIQRSWNLRK
jgi:hypothetical protein